MTTALARTYPRAIIVAALSLAATMAGLSITSGPAEAASGGAYAAMLVTPLPAPRREIVDGAIWRCEGDRCTAPADGARPQSICGKVSRRFGPLSRFATPQGELAADQLARCNGAS